MLSQRARRFAASVKAPKTTKIGSMPSHKNQHFVPRCYLRPFTIDGTGKALNIFNIDRGRAISRAPVKGQCSRDYFYGDDLALERAIQPFEGAYASLLRQVESENFILSEEHRCLLRQFWSLQHLRTEHASRRMMAMSAELDGAVNMSADFKLTIGEAVRGGMNAFLQAEEAVGDLKVCLVRNRTPVPFITSDDPAVMANRWFQHDARARWLTPGLGSSAALLLLPLTPVHMCLGRCNVE